MNYDKCLDWEHENLVQFLEIYLTYTILNNLYIHYSLLSQPVKKFGIRLQTGQIDLITLIMFIK